MLSTWSVIMLIAVNAFVGISFLLDKQLASAWIWFTYAASGFGWRAIAWGYK